MPNRGSAPAPCWRSNASNDPGYPRRKLISVQINRLIPMMKFPYLPSFQKCPPSRMFWSNKAPTLTNLLSQHFQQPTEHFLKNPPNLCYVDCFKIHFMLCVTFHRNSVIVRIRQNIWACLYNSVIGLFVYPMSCLCSCL